MAENMPIVLVPGLNCSARLFAPQLPHLWHFGPPTVATHTRDDTMAAVAARILEAAPPRFALAGLSMGGYIALEIVRQASGRVDRLALLDTGARADPPEAQQLRKTRIALAEDGKFDEVIESTWSIAVHPDRRADAALKAEYIAMAHDVGPQAFVRQQRAIMARLDSRPLLPGIRCPTLVLVGAQDALTPPHLADEMAAGISGARLVQVADCGHISTLEQPAAVTAALMEWLAA